LSQKRNEKFFRQNDKKKLFGRSSVSVLWRHHHTTKTKKKKLASHSILIVTRKIIYMEEDRSNNLESSVSSTASIIARETNGVEKHAEIIVANGLDVSATKNVTTQDASRIDNTFEVHASIDGGSGGGGGGVPKAPQKRLVTKQLTVGQQGQQQRALRTTTSTPTKVTKQVPKAKAEMTSASTFLERDKRRREEEARRRKEEKEEAKNRTALFWNDLHDHYRHAGPRCITLQTSGEIIHSTCKTFSLSLHLSCPYVE
jgi:hypothetical protein